MLHLLSPSKKFKASENNRVSHAVPAHPSGWKWSETEATVIMGKWIVLKTRRRK